MIQSSGILLFGTPCMDSKMEIENTAGPIFKTIMADKKNGSNLQRDISKGTFG